MQISGAEARTCPRGRADQDAVKIHRKDCEVDAPQYGGVMTVTTRVTVNPACRMDDVGH